MSWKLALIDSGLAVTRTLARRGQRNEALAQARRLLNRSDLPLSAAADTHRVAGEIHLESERFSRARRHLRASLGLEPNHARTHFLLGLAYERDPHGDDLRAARRFRAASRLAPSNAAYRAAFGRAAVRCYRVRRGVRELLAAAETTCKDVPLLEVVIEGLLEAGRVAAAHRIIVKARFSCPRSGEVRRLWERVRYESARRSQRRASSTQDAEGPATEGAVRLLPFLRVVHSNIRFDTASFPRPHLIRSRQDR